MTERTCANCEYWITQAGGHREYGDCKEIQDALTFEVEAGWSGGYVESVETDKDFGCIRFKEASE